MFINTPIHISMENALLRPTFASVKTLSTVSRMNMAVNIKSRKGYSRALLGFSVSSYKATKTGIRNTNQLVTKDTEKNYTFGIIPYYTIGEAIKNSSFLQVSPKLLSL